MLERQLVMTKNLMSCKSLLRILTTRAIANLSRATACSLAFIAATFAMFAQAQVVVISDGFGDGDRHNNGIALEETDDTLPIEGDIIGSFTPLGGNGTPLVFPEGTTVPAVSAIDDASDTGIRWTSTGGITDSGFGTPAARPRIVDDTAGVLPDSTGGVGFFNAIANETQTIPALDSGLALGFEGAGRSRSIAGFFETDNDFSTKEGTIAVGPQVNDSVTVSFDFRVWLSAPNFNGSSDNDNHIPGQGQVRFGLYEDADDQLGSVAPNSGPAFTPTVNRVWGQDDGFFRGDNGPIGASGDPGWFANLPILDPDEPVNPLFGPFADGRDARITLETNDPSTSGATHLSGSSIVNGGDIETVALPDQMASTFTALENTRRYNVSLTLTRIDETGGSTSSEDLGDNLEATLTVFDLDNPGVTFTLSGINALDPEGADPNAGFITDSFDYFAITTGGATDSDELDFIIDNFSVVVEGSNEGDFVTPVDADGDGDVDGADFLILQRDNPELIPDWQAAFGGAAASGVTAIPEPSSMVIIGIGTLLVLGGYRRQ